MKRTEVLLGMLPALWLFGCGGGSSIEIFDEPAGANCPTGGYRVEADGEVFYACDGQATTEEIAAGAEGNPCAGDSSDDPRL